MTKRNEQLPGANYFLPLLGISAWTAFIVCAFPQIDPVIMAMTYLVANVAIAVRYGQWPSILCSALSVAAFDFFFIPPHFHFAVFDARYWVTFAVLFVVTFLTSRLTVQSRKSAELALAAEMKADREKLISSLVSSVSHDLKTPLTSISGAVSTLLEQEAIISPEDRKQLLEAINDESLRLNRLVGKTLQIMKLESGAVNPRKEVHSLEAVVGSVLVRLDSLLEGRKVVTEIPGELTVPLDELLIEQVLANLLENAVRHTPMGTPIDIRAFREPEHVRVEILDRGSGVPEGERERIFEKFYRSGKKDDWGSGLGLAICQGILKIHQGEIGVRGRDGGGCVFYFSLPVRMEKTA